MKDIFRPKPLIRTVDLDVSALDEHTRRLRGLYTEWIITNGLGGYASGTVGGPNTRRFHGWLIAALSAPHGRMMMLNRLRERLIVGEKEYTLDCDDLVHAHDPQKDGTSDPISPFLKAFRLDCGLPVWTYGIGDVVLEKRVCMIHGQNTTHITYVLLQGAARLEVQPA